MAQTIGSMTQTELARFIQGAVRAQLAQLPISLTLQSVKATENLEATKTVNFTAFKVLLPNLPKSDPHVVGQLWNNAGVLNISAG